MPQWAANEVFCGNFSYRTSAKSRASSEPEGGCPRRELKSLRRPPEIRFLRKHTTHSIAPQARKQSFACHFAALVFYGLSAGSGFTCTRGYPMLCTSGAQPRRGGCAIANGESRIPNDCRLGNSLIGFRGQPLVFAESAFKLSQRRV